MSNWCGVTAEDGADEWHYSDQGDGVLWSEPGLWVFKYSPGPSASWTEHRIESAESLDQAKREAEKIMDRIDYLSSPASRSRRSTPVGGSTAGGEDDRSMAVDR
jgi:hypothetical protein